MDSSTNMGGNLSPKVIHPNKIYSINLPLLGRFMYSRDNGSGLLLASDHFISHLHALHLDKDGNVKGEHHLGSGLVTHAGVRLLSQDTAVSAGSACLNAMKYHGSGTGSTPAAATDTALQTAIGTTATLGANSNSDSSPNAIFTSIGTISYASGATVTEWILCNSATLSGATAWDHKVFGGIITSSGDAIQFTYNCTFNSGG